MKNIALLVIVTFTIINSLFSQSRRQAYQEGDVRLAIKLPHFNTLAFTPDKKFRDVEYGFNGYGLGLEYSYRDRKFIAISGSFVMTFEWFVPVPLDVEYNKILLSSYFNITDNMILRNFTIGYGINYSANTWKEWTRTVIGKLTDSKSFTNNNLGLTLNAYFRAGKTLHLGLIYQPSLLKLNNKPELIYEHSISAGVVWRFKIFNVRNRPNGIRRI